MAQPLVQLRQTIVDLVGGGSAAPVSFFDARQLVRQIRRVRQDLDDELVGALILLHDAPQTTDGARQVLSEVLRGIAKRRAQERDLAARSVFLADDGKRARVGNGETLTLHLEERREHGYRWEVVGQTRGLSVNRSRQSDDADMAVLEVRAGKSGIYALELVERRPLTLEVDPQQPAATRSFRLTVAVE